MGNIINTIGLCGTHSTGKTEIFNQLRSHQLFSNHVFKEEAIRWVSQFGLPINEDGGDFTQLTVAYKQLSDLINNRKLVTDRTLFDTVVYTKYLLDRGAVTEQTYIEVCKCWINSIPMYGLLFYASPNEGLTPDGTRSNNDFFRDEVYRLFERAIEKYQVPVIRLHGTTPQRVNQIIQTMEILERG